MNKLVDVLVVGLGPAGGAAAMTAARAGLRVAAVERRHKIGVPAQCAELLPLPLARYACADGVLQQRTLGMAIHLPSGRVEKSRTPGMMIDRAAFDQALARQAGENGADLHLSSRLIGLDSVNSLATVATPQGALTIQYRMLIAADGPHSFVARALGLPRLATIHARQYRVALNSPRDEAEIWLSSDYSGGYAWLFPRGEVANLGLGIARRSGANPKSLLDQLHRKLAGEGRVGAVILGRTGGEIPVGGLRDILVSGNVLFVGDAAGLTHPVTGAGIASAVISGEMAGEAATEWLLRRNTAALAGFATELSELYGPAYQRAAAARRASLSAGLSANGDAAQRRGWVTFPEYFTEKLA